MDQPFDAGSDQGLSRPLNPTRKETSALPAPIDSGTFLPPTTPDHFMETYPARIGWAFLITDLAQQITQPRPTAPSVCGYLPPIAFPMCIHRIHSRLMKDVGLRIRIDRDLREQFVAACKADDKPASQVIREFMREYVMQHEARNSAIKSEKN